MPKEYGGLGLKDLKCLNKALLGKWGWRALSGEESLWVELAMGKEIWDGRGLSGANMFRPSVRLRGWWGDVVECLRDGKGDWFMSAARRRVGDGERTSFWKDCWVGERPLCREFPRLFELCADKERSVGGAGKWEGECWKWEFGWRRSLREWEVESLNELSSLMACRKINSIEADRWIWQLEARESYSVRSSYRFLVDRKATSERAATSWAKLLWGCWAVPKAKANAWRVFIGRIATKSELLKRGVHFSNSVTECPLCGDENETIRHLFFECRSSWELWSRCLEWLGVQAALPGIAAESFLTFCHLGYRRNTCKLLATIWVCMVWSLWKTRNNIVFNSGKWERDKILEEIKSFVWGWGVGKIFYRDKGMKFRDWCANSCLSRMEQ